MRLVRPRRWTLRARLLSLLAALLVVVCLVVGTVTAIQLRGYLVGRLDTQLLSAGGRSQQVGDPSGPGGANGGRVRARAGRRTASAMTPACGSCSPDRAPAPWARASSTRRSLRPASSARTAPSPCCPQQVSRRCWQVDADGRPHTSRIGDRGSYRVLATRLQDGDVLVTALPLRGVDTTVDRLILVELAVAGIALLLAMAAGWVIMRRTLRPLRRVAATATRVSMLPLERGEVALAERVAGADTDPHTEVGQVGGSLNRLLDHVTHALTARQASETRVRRFVADASHELRTPLASIRGYAELTRRNRDARAARHRLRTGTGRVRGAAHDDDGRGPAVAGPAGLRTTAGHRPGRPHPAGHRRGQRRPGRRSRPPLAPRSARRADHDHRRRRRACTRC